MLRSGFVEEDKEFDDVLVKFEDYDISDLADRKVYKLKDEKLMDFPAAIQTLRNNK